MIDFSMSSFFFVIRLMIPVIGEIGFVWECALRCCCDGKREEELRFVVEIF